jgi:hypothetical protein
MAIEISRDITGHGADRGRPAGTLEVKTRTGTEFRNAKNSQTSDPPARMRSCLAARCAHLVSSSTSRTAAIP